MDEATVALLAYAELLTRAPGSVGREEIEAMRGVGWSDRAIHDAVQICSYFNYINRIADALGVEPEDWIDERGRVIQQPT